MVSKANEDLPEPLSPVITTSWSRGISMSRFLRLCSRAPLMMMRSISAYMRGLAGATRHSVAGGSYGSVMRRGIFDCRDHAGGARDATAREVISRAVVGRGANKGQAEGDIHGAIELQRLKRNQALVVIHRDRPVEAETIVMPHEGRIRRQRAEGLESGALRTPNRRTDAAQLLVAEQPPSPACGLSPSTAIRGRATPSSRSRCSLSSRIES